MTCVSLSARHGSRPPRRVTILKAIETLAATGPFLGGFNLAFCALSLLFVINASAFPTGEQRGILFAVFVLGQGSQFVANVPMALDNRKGKGAWQVRGYNQSKHMDRRGERDEQ